MELDLPTCYQLIFDENFNFNITNTLSFSNRTTTIRKVQLIPSVSTKISVTIHNYRKREVNIVTARCQQ